MSRLVVRSEPRPGVTQLTLSRPDKLNAMNQPLLDELHHQLRDLERSCDGPEPGISARAGSSRRHCELAQADIVVGGDHLGRLFADHDRSSVGIAAGDIRPDAGIGYP